MISQQATVSIVQQPLQETPFNYSDKDLMVVKEMVRESLNLLGGVDAVLKGAQTVVLKPNLVEVPVESTRGSVLTDHRVIEATVSLLQDYGVKKVQVAEGKSVNLRHEGAGPLQAFEKTGIADVVRRAGGEILGWGENDPYIDVDVPGGEVFATIGVPKSILDADLFINLPKLKTHCQTVVTLGIKNMQGVFKVEEKIAFHNASFPWKMIDILKVAKPHLTIVDGLICGEGYGPIYPSPVEMNLLAASEDIVAVDAVCTAIMGIEPFEVPITCLAHTEGLGTGNLDEIKVKGASIESVQKHFKRAQHWNPIGASKNMKVFAGGACRFCLAQVGAVIGRLKINGELDDIKETCVLIGHNPPQPCKNYERVLVIGDCAKAQKDQGEFIAGCPPLPSVQIVHKIKEMSAEKISPNQCSK
ncbi:MAG: DUF362 domain-containing protein [bacterium]|nr:DUF362 domain-containing protein [bacterium]